jgi:hypothetical protein
MRSALIAGRNSPIDREPRGSSFHTACGVPGGNDHPLAALQSVIDTGHATSHRPFEHLKPLLLLCMYVIAKRRRDLACAHRVGAKDSAG